MIIEVTEGNNTLYVPAENILRMESVRTYTVLHKKGGVQYVLSKNLGEVIRKLNSSTQLKEVFFRVNRSFAVNLQEVNRYQHGRGGNVVMSDNAVITVAQRRKAELLQLLQKLKEK